MRLNQELLEDYMIYSIKVESITSAVTLLSILPTSHQWVKQAWIEHSVKPLLSSCEIGYLTKLGCGFGREPFFMGEIT